ncbi:hypothetical protein [Streptomyces sp. NPDC053431]|uniref:hypothetical protein n=1 Tax=Streptomyces sp. NPDC053431 TaxID=3365703 RepID=UPI0037D7D742
MTTTTTGPEATEAPDATGTTRALRVMALCALPVLLLCALLTVVAVLQDAIGGDGAAGGLADAARWALAGSGLCALTGAAVPRDGMSDRARGFTVAAAYTLAVLAPALAALD